MRRALLLAVLLLLCLSAVVAVPPHAVDAAAALRSPLPIPSLPRRVVVPEGAHLVKYEVQSRFGASLTYMVGGGTEQREAGAGVRSVRFAGWPGDFLYLSAQNVERQGRVTCRIYVDGKLAQEATSSGAYVIATCKAQIPR